MISIFKLERSDAEGGLIYSEGQYVRVRRAGSGDRAHTIVLEVWNGRFWAKAWSTDEMSNDMAYSEMRSRAIYLRKQVDLLGDEFRPPLPPVELAI